MSIKEIRKALDNREISVAELTKAHLDVIASIDDKIGACLYVNEEFALRMANKAQERIDAGKSAPLTGIPIGLKDNLCTIDMPTTCASKMLKGFMSPFDATVIERFRAQDAVMIAKLNMDEFAMGSANINSAYKLCRNPYDLSRVPGGSCGGSAAAVAAGMCVGALGSDTGGSIRQPSSFCGVTGLRPTYGKVPRYGCIAFASSLDQVGPIAKSAADCRAILDCIAGYDPNDMTSARETVERESVSSLADLKVGLIQEMMGEEIESATKKAVYEAASWFEKVGASVEIVSLPMLKYGVPAYYLISSAEASANLSRFDGVRYGHRTDKFSNYDELVERSRAEGFGKEVKRRIMLGTYALCSGYYDAYYKKAVHLASLVRKEYQNLFDKFDILLSPVSPMPAFTFDDAPSDPAQMYVADLCTVGAVLAGLPALSTPCGYTSCGLPIGLMITGNYFDDNFILSVAEQFEQSFTRMEAEVRP
jgi:aspartyl-tRNA(Asn)/glutamyl-tRNA(Gln) amidotransferase subunit A